MEFPQNPFKKSLRSIDNEFSLPETQDPNSEQHKLISYLESLIDQASKQFSADDIREGIALVVKHGLEKSLLENKASSSYNIKINEFLTKLNRTLSKLPSEDLQKALHSPSIQNLLNKLQ